MHAMNLVTQVRKSKYFHWFVRLINLVALSLAVIIARFGLPLNYNDRVQNFLRVLAERANKLPFPKHNNENVTSQGKDSKHSTATDSEKNWQEPMVEFQEIERGGVKLVVRLVKSCHKAKVLRNTQHQEAAEEEEHNSTDAVIEKPKKLMFFACPLGQCGFSIFYPIMAHYGDEYTYVTWDYRGFFKSSSPTSSRRVSIHEHGEDGAVVLSHVLSQLGFNRDPTDMNSTISGQKTTESNQVEVVAVGHSMGVQVLLEMSLLYPKFADHMILLNGAHGQVFSTAFQPVLPIIGLRIPLFGTFARALVAFVCSYPKAISLWYEYVFKHDIVDFVLYLWGTSIMGSKALRSMAGSKYLGDFFHSYLSGISSSERNSYSYARTFQELDMHSVRHLLHEIEIPTLLVSGFWDMYTPCSHMFEMARKMPNAVHYCDMYSTHASIVEHPEAVVEKIDGFLRVESNIAQM